MEISRHMGTAADVCNTNRFLRLLGGAPVSGLAKVSPPPHFHIAGVWRRELRAKPSEHFLKSCFPDRPSCPPWAAHSREGFSPAATRSRPAAGLGGVVGQGWGCPMVAVADTGDLLPGAGPP